MKKSVSFMQLVRMKLRSFGRSNRAIFDDVYKNHRWGSGDDNDTSSGKGSFEENSKEYEEFVVNYIKSNGITSIVDIGCGDFQVSRRILGKLNGHDISYMGTDVSRVIIDRNRSLFEKDKIKFMQLDAAKENIPEADLITVREVLQHLPNRDVDRVLTKLVDQHKNAHILVTNTVAKTPGEINMDIPAGSASRAGLGSGLWIDQPPFNYEIEEVCRVPHRDFDTVIITSRLLGRKSAV